MDRQAFREKLHDILRSKLLTGLQSYVEQRLDAYTTLLKLIAALERKYDNSEIIREGLASIYSKISKELDRDDSEKLANFYSSLVKDISAEFPNQVVWEQREDRFEVKDADSLLTSVAKGGKNAIRFSTQKWHSSKQAVSKIFNGSVDQWEPWTQTVPMQRVVNYHLLDDVFAEKLIHGTERVQRKIITELENLLVNHDKDAEKKFDLNAITNSLQKKVETAENVLQKLLNNEVNELESKLLWQIERIGTVEKRASFYNTQRINQYDNEFRQKLLKVENQWLATEQLLLERTQNLTHFLNVWQDVQAQNEEFLVDFKDHFQDYLGGPLDRFYEILQESIQVIKTADSTYRQIRQQKDQLSDYVSDKLIEPIQHLQNQQVFSRKAEHFSEDLLVAVNQVPEKISFVHDIRVEEEPPKADQRELEWRVLLVRTLRERVLNPIQPSEQTYDDFLAAILRILVEIEDIIEINLESALTAYKDKDRDGDSDPDDIAGEALERLLAKVDDLRTHSSEKYADIEKIILDGTGEFGKSIVDLLDGADAKELQIFRAKFKVKETTKDWKTQVDARVARTQDRLSVWSRFGGQKSKHYVSEAQKFFGYGDQEITESKRADIAGYLSETDQKLNSLPYIYRRLFKFDEIADERFYVPIPETAVVFKKAFEQWKNSFPAAFAVVGETGSGKSTFLDLMTKQEVVGKNPVRMTMNETIHTEEDLVKFMKKELDIDCKKSVDEVIEEMGQWDKKKVVVLDCVENCFVRNINGYEAIEKLCYLISETKDQVFWVVSCSRYGWQFLDKTQSISEYFSHAARTDTLNAEQIEKVILSRHRSSGYNLQFEPGEDTKKSRTYRKLQDQPEKAQEHLKRKYFEKLTEMAEGNASIAMILWIRSIRDFDNASFYIRPLEITSIEMIEDLSPQVLFTLAAFVLHNTLSDSDLSMILNITKEESRLMLIRLRSRGLLLKNGDNYSLNHLVYRQIVRGLKQRNIIHLV